MPTLTQLLARLRVELDDEAMPQLWSDTELVEDINRSVDEACLRARLIRDSDTPECCDIRLRPGIERYEMHPAVLGIHRARIPNRQALEEITADQLDYSYGTGNNHRGYPGGYAGGYGSRWEDQRAAYPTHFVQNLDACWIRFYPIPTEVHTVKLTVWRKPVQPLSLETPEREPEVHNIHHWNLLHWAMHLAYSKHDAEAHDPDAAARCAQMFAEMFGHRRSAEVTEILRRTPNLKVKAHFR